MHPTTTTPGRALDARLLVTVVGVLMGLLGMHALTAPSSHDTAPAARLAAAAAGHDGTDDGSHATSGDHATSTGESHAGAATSSAPAEDTDGHGSHSPGSVLMMCLAVLAVALSLLLPLARALTTGFLRLPRLTSALLPTRGHRLGTGPPPVWKFSVVRC